MEVKFKIEYLDVVDKHVKALPHNIRNTVKRAIEQKLAVNPIAFGKPLQYSFKGLKRLRVEDYRVIYSVDVSTHIVTIVAIMHRKNVYDTLRGVYTC